MPVASATELDNIYQFVGTTTSSYTNGYFYKCISDGATPTPTYSWSRIDVQPAGSGSLSGLSDVTITSATDGQYLKYNGTNWVNDTVSYLPTTGGTLTGNLNIASSSNTGMYTSYKLQFNTATSDNVILTTVNNNIFSVYNSHRSVGYSFNLAAQSIYPEHTGSGNESSLGSAISKWTTVYTTKLNNGADIAIPEQAGRMAIQVTSFPTASATVGGEIYQYIGTTDSTYTNGYFYKCVYENSTWSWKQYDTQPQGGGSLPSQSGQSGKFLTTDGTDASWATVDALPSQTSQSGKFLTTDGSSASWAAINALQNQASDSNSLAVGGTSTDTGNIVRVGQSATANGYSSTVVGYNATTGSYGGWATVIGSDATANGGWSVAIGNNTTAGVAQTKLNCVAIGSSASATGGYSIAIGSFAQTTADYSIILNASGTSSYTNTTPNSFAFANSNGMFTLVNADGTVPEARLADMTSAAQGQVLTLDVNSNATWATPAPGARIRVWGVNE